MISKSVSRIRGYWWRIGQLVLPLFGCDDDDDDDDEDDDGDGDDGDGDDDDGDGDDDDDLPNHFHPQV